MTRLCRCGDFVTRSPFKSCQVKPWLCPKCRRLLMNKPKQPTLAELLFGRAWAKCEQIKDR